MSKTVFMIITSKCNKSCPFCYYKQDSFRKKIDSFNFFNFDDLLENLRRSNFNELTITGGEPLLKKELCLKIIKKANKEDFKINLSTNGTLLNKKILKNFKEINKFKIYFSSQYIDFLSNAFLKKLSLDFSLAVIYVVTRKNLGNLEKMIKKMDDYGIELIIQPAYINRKNKYFDKLSLKNLNYQEKINFEKILKKWAKKNRKKAYFNLIRSYYLNDKSKYPSYCHNGIDDLVIDSDGSVFPCFHRQDLKAGNILEDSLNDMLTKIRSFSKQVGNASCFDEYCIPLFF